MKHPALNDVKLWKLLAEKNGLSVAADGKGNPTANLQRGTSLVLPTTMEILEFRSRGIKGLQSVKTSVDLSSVKTVVELVSQECPNCHRLITQSCEMCPACFFTIATQESDEPITERCDSMFISETPSTPLEYNGATARLDAQSEKTAFAFDREDQSATVPSPKFNQSDATSQDLFSAETMPFSSSGVSRQAENYRSPVVAETVLENQEVLLSENCRLICTEVERLGTRISRAQLEVMKDDRWTIILVYELSDEASVRREALPTGGMWNMKIELPLSLAQDMVQNDLSSNWESYCKKFLSGKRISA